MIQHLVDIVLGSITLGLFWPEKHNCRGTLQMREVKRPCIGADDQFGPIQEGCQFFQIQSRSETNLRSGENQ